MRLLKCNDAGNFSWTKDFLGEEEIPPYVILSHTWKDGQEVTFDDLMNGTGKNKAGYEKMRFCAEQAERDGLRYFWVDTCCINKADSVELQDAINSMFRWYHDATICYVYLSDVSIDEQNTGDELSEMIWEPAFRKSRWFSRGWTLQELLAPRSVKFFSQGGQKLGDKITLERQIHEITGIAIPALQGTPLSTFSVEERLSWTKGRQTTRREDKAYSLLGIFGIYMLPNYGEGEDHAFERLLRKIEKSSKEPLLQQQVPIQTYKAQLDTVRSVEMVSRAPWVIPFPRPQSFVGRAAQLGHLYEHTSSEGCQRLAIYGLGGCGKTALALESAYRTRERYPTRAIFWVPAVSQESFEQAYRKIGALLGIMAITDDKVDARQLLKERLSDESFGEWLMIIDNADDDSVLFGSLGERSSPNRLIDYLPYSRKGSIIFTTRTRGAAVKLAESNVIPLGELRDVEAEEMLRKRLLPEHHLDLKDSKVVHEFLNILAYLALAIIQSVAFINTNDITISDYISLYGNSEGDAIDLLSEEFEDQGRYRDTKNPVATTWYISFKQIQRENKLAADYLSFMACIVNSDIPASILLGNGSKLEQAKAIGTLKAYAFITERQPQKDGQEGRTQKISQKVFDVHPLVHLAMQGWLKAQDQWNDWARNTLAYLVEIIPFGDYDKREVWTAYLPHAMHVIDLYEVYGMEDRISLLYRVGCCEDTLGRYKAAENAHRQVFEQRKKLLGKEHPDTLKSMNTLALALNYQGRYVEAEKMHRETLAIDEKLLGKEHPHTLTSMSNVALALSEQGKYAEAEKIYRETLALDEKVSGKEHPHTLTSMSNLAQALSRQEKYEEAEKMHQDELELRERVSGKEHPHTLISMNNVAITLKNQGKYVEAEKMHQETLALQEKVLGKEHPHTLTSMSNLAQTLNDQGKYTKAEKIYRETLALQEKVLGKEHPHTLVGMNNLAQVLNDQGEYAEAQKMHQETLALREKVLGKEHPYTLMSMNNLAQVLNDQGEYAEAQKMHQETLVLREKVLGKEHSQTLISMSNLAKALSSQGKYEEVEKIYRATLSVDEKVLGKENLRTLKSMCNLAKVLSDQGKYEEAEKTYQEELVLREKVLGKEHPYTLTNMIHLARVLGDQGKYGEAEKMYREELVLRKKVSGKEHPHTLRSMVHLAQALGDQEKYEEAETMFRAALALDEKLSGKEHPHTLTSMSNLARVLGDQRKYSEAISLMTMCFQLRKKTLGLDHPRVKSALKALNEWQMQT